MSNRLIVLDLLVSQSCITSVISIGLSDAKFYGSRRPRRASVEDRIGHLVTSTNTSSTRTVPGRKTPIQEVEIVEPEPAPRAPGWPVCYTLILLGSLVILLSFGLGLYYGIAKDRIGDGFTLAGWITAVGTLVLAVPITQLYPKCKCWKKSRSGAC